MKKLLLVLLLSSTSAFAQVEYVDMFMGQKGSSNCTIGPALPHASIHPGPDTPYGGHDGYAEGKPVRGFSQLHVSGTGWGRYGQILLSPQVGFNADEDGHDSDIAEETATPYYYKARLTRYDILAEVAPSHHAAIYRFTYPSAAVAANDAFLLLDITHNITEHIAPEVKGRYLGGNIQYDPRSRMLTGYGEYKGGFGPGEPYRVYFAMYSDNIDLQKAQIGAQPYDNGFAKSRLFARIPVATAVANVQIAVSLRSVDNAKQYLHEETLGKGFGTIEQKAREQWNEVLDKIRVNAQTDEQRKLFYTSMFFAYLMPRDRKDDNPRFLGENYDDHYCIWDTWRTKYPLMVLLDESFVARTVTSFVNRYKNDGCCNPTFTSSLDWRERQGGDDCENVVADALVKDVQGFDRAAAYEYVKHNAQNRRSPEYLRLGWQPEEGQLMGCSNALEYAYNDYCTYLSALAMKDKEFARQMLRRSKSWRRLFCKQTADEPSQIKGFITPRKADGEFVPLDPRKVYESWVEYFYEGNSWTYTLFAPHDFKTLVKLCGGKKLMVERLQYGFDNDLIALWNEPGFLSPFIFSHCDRPDLTARYVARLRKKNFSLADGFCNNEDSGAMGAWFVLTGIGLFPNAGQDFYYLLPPAYSDISVALSSGNTLHITREGQGETVVAVFLNGKKLKGNTVKHSQIRNGGELRFVVR